MKIDKKTGWLIGGVAVALGGGAAVYFLFLKKKIQSDKYGNQVIKKKRAGGLSGGVQTATGNSGSTLVEPNWNNPYDMNYDQDVQRWVAPKSIRTLNATEADQMAQTIHGAKGTGWWANDDEAAVQGIFQKRLQDKVQVANLSRAFWNRYQKDLWEYLNGFLSNNEMETLVQQPVRNLPNYRFT